MSCVRPCDRNNVFNPGSPANDRTHSELLSIDCNVFQDQVEEGITKLLGLLCPNVAHIREHRSYKANLVLAQRLGNLANRIGVQVSKLSLTYHQRSDVAFKLGSTLTSEL